MIQRLTESTLRAKRMELDAIQKASAEQFDRQSDRYGRSHILADVSDVEEALTHVTLPERAEALDVATGGGHTGILLAERGFRVTLGDIAPGMLQRAAALAAERGLTVQTREFPAEAIPFDDSTLDLVTCRVAAHHFSSPARFVQETARVLRPGGWFVLIDGSLPDDDPDTDRWLNAVEKWRDPSHGRLLPPREWRELCEPAGLRVTHSALHALKQPDLEWYFETAATPPPNRQEVLEAVRTAPDTVRNALRLDTEEGRIVWWWPRLTLAATRPS